MLGAIREVVDYPSSGIVIESGDKIENEQPRSSDGNEK